jgi:NDP-sugar pyrophosphorylase family protein
MLTVIHQIPHVDCSHLPIAERPLLERQLQWLRGSGCLAVAIELSPDRQAQEDAQRIVDRAATGMDVRFVTSRAPLGPRALASKAAFAPGEPFMAVPANVLGNIDLKKAYERYRSRGVAARGTLSAKAAAQVPDGQVQLFVANQGPMPVQSYGGWLARIDDAPSALAVTQAILSGSLPTGAYAAWDVLVHAAEIGPGIWVSRHARIQSSAQLKAPVLIGNGALVRSGAVVGPGAVIGERAVVSAGAHIVNSHVSAETIVGERIAVRDAIADPDGVTDIHSREFVATADKLTLCRRRTLRWPQRLRRARVGA